MSTDTARLKPISQRKNNHHHKAFTSKNLPGSKPAKFYSF